MPASKSKSGVKFFPGQEAVAGKVFRSGVVEGLLEGRGLPGDERAQQTGLELLRRGSAHKGMRGSGLEARKEVDFLAKSSGEIADRQIERLMQFLQPAGSYSIGGRPGFMAHVMGKG